MTKLTVILGKYRMDVDVDEDDLSEDIFLMHMKYLWQGISGLRGKRAKNAELSYRMQKMIDDGKPK